MVSSRALLAHRAVRTRAECMRRGVSRALPCRTRAELGSRGTEIVLSSVEYMYSLIAASFSAVIFAGGGVGSVVFESYVRNVEK